MASQIPETEVEILESRGKLGVVEMVIVRNKCEGLWVFGKVEREEDEWWKGVGARETAGVMLRDTAIAVGVFRVRTRR